MTPQPPTIFLIDDDPSVLRAIERLLRSAGFTVAAFPSARAFLGQHDPAAPGCLLLDVSMPEIDGPELQRRLHLAGDTRPVLFLTGCGDVPTGVRAMKSGAVDFLTKPCDDAVLLEAVTRALALDAQARAVTDLLATLTPREHQVMLHVVAGDANKAIALQLGTVEDTVKVHRRRIMQKLQVRSLPDLVRLVEKALKRL